MSDILEELRRWLQVMDDTNSHDIDRDVNGFCALRESHIRKAADEIEQLRSWKTQTTRVLEEWDEVFELCGEPGELGQMKPVAAHTEIERLQTELDRFETLPITDDLIEQICVYFHDAYERAAVGAGWETQMASRKPWADVPEANKQTMRDTIKQVLPMMPVQFRKREN